MNQKLISFGIASFTLLLSFPGQSIANQKQSDVWSTCFSASSAMDRYVALINCVHAHEPKEDGSFQDRVAYDQSYGTVLSYVGQDKEARQVYDRAMGVPRPPVEGELSGLSPKSALNFILQRSKTKQVVMINEAHHVAQSRGLTLEMLQSLYAQGFRYLAAETFSMKGIDEANRLGFPTQETGFYSVEPVFGMMIREAKRIGFTLVAYEHEDDCDYASDPNGCQNKREEGQARNLIERILKKDPSAKIIVHAGYGHIDEVGGSPTFPWKPMARYFKELSGIDPLTIDQVEFQENGRREIENPFYRSILSKFRVLTPTVLVTPENTGWIWPMLQGHYDLQVILPKLDYENGRPKWRRTLLNQKSVLVSMPPTCLKEDCLVQAVYKNEVRQRYVPADQILVTKADRAQLLLSPGTYMIKTLNLKGKILASTILRVH